MVNELSNVWSAMQPALPLAGLILCAVVFGAAVMWLALESRVASAKEMERKASALEALRDALFEPTAWVPSVQLTQVEPVSIRVRVGAVLVGLREWCRDAVTPGEEEPDWAPGEIKALTVRPPLRVKSGVPARQRFLPRPVIRIPWTAPFGQLLPACARHDFLGVAR